jgi:tripartite-type tricarboxylate transporter receptor subunit TctC
MKSMSGFRLATVAASLLILSPSLARAQETWPNKRIAFVVGFAAGGFADTVGRIIAGKVSERLGQPIIMQNMEGAGGNTAARHVTMQPADGYTFLVTTTGLAINETLLRNRQFSATAFRPMAIPVIAPELMVTSKQSGLKSMADLLAAAKENHAFMGTPGIGSGSHIAAEYFFKKLAKVDVKHIPFQGGAPAMQALRTGDINLLAATATQPALPPVVSGEMLGLAVASNERDPALPNTPTFAELGFPGMIANSWTGIFARAETPEPIVKRMNQEINEAMKDPDVRKKIDTLGLLISQRSAEESNAFFKEEIARWASMVEATGLSM